MLTAEADAHKGPRRRHRPARVAIVHDYLTQTGGAERVVLSMMRAFPDAPLYTSVYSPERTFPEFRGLDIRPMPGLNRLSSLRREHRVGLPLYGPAFRRLSISADVVLCSSSGWAHFTDVQGGRKFVYCYTPARWLYQRAAYLRDRPIYERAAVASMAPLLSRMDLRAARSAHCYLTSSRAVQERIANTYGINAEVLPPPPPTLADGPQRPMGLEAGFCLVVSRLLPYKNVDVVVEACRSTGRRLVVVGEGPDRGRLAALAGEDTYFLGRVDDATLRWLYSSCAMVIALSYEDFGLVPIEANSFGAPVIALRWGGYLDTLVEGETGCYCDSPLVEALVEVMSRVEQTDWSPCLLKEHAKGFSEERFIERLRQVVVPEHPPND